MKQILEDYTKVFDKLFFLLYFDDESRMDTLRPKSLDNFFH